MNRLYHNLIEAMYVLVAGYHPEKEVPFKEKRNVCLGVAVFLVVICALLQLSN